MRLTMLVTMGLAALVLAGCGQGEASTDAPSAPAAVAAAPEAGVPAAAPDATSAPAALQRAAAYTPVPISAEDQPGRARQIRCQVGTDPETNCTFTPLFGDGSFQLDGPGIAYRMVISDGEGGLFAVFGPEDRVPVGGTYRRDKRDRACWIANEETPAPARICAR
ncbi:MAG: hypothetical protein K2X25_17405 [Caulobacteraceae bacterium]|nr:hypothetical protein [Caulobacteraceae bacterium]